MARVNRAPGRCGKPAGAPYHTAARRLSRRGRATRHGSSGLRIRCHGHAIVSDDDRIADADGRMPEALRNDADWRQFQAALDAADIVLLGRLGHEAHPNPGRRRMVVSGSARALEKRADAWWWNPEGLPLAEALARIAIEDAIVPRGGVLHVAVPGGTQVFDLVLAGPGFDVFDLARKAGVRVPGGRPVFSACDMLGQGTEEVLAGAGLAASPSQFLDPAAGVTLTRWRRRA